MLLTVYIQKSIHYSTGGDLDLDCRSRDLGLHKRDEKLNEQNFKYRRVLSQ